MAMDCACALELECACFVISNEYIITACQQSLFTGRQIKTSTALKQMLIFTSPGAQKTIYSYADNRLKHFRRLIE